ncbi:TonB-dependent receptor [Parabacteroides sp. OttesenSCG-928-J18]|nr:TonB-dependent receptor [Parabacteroides sp. OttesenSCG-928-J18]
MRLTLFLLLVTTSISFATGLYAQNTQINLKAGVKTLQELFSEIEDNSEFIFIYKDNTINLSKTVEVSEDTYSITEILDRTLKNTSTQYKIIDRQVIFYQANPLPITPQDKRTELRGRVTDAKTGEIIIGASVVLKGTTIGSTTDVDGNYSFEYPGGRQTVVASYLGYSPKEVTISSPQILDFKLDEDAFELEEAVVVGYGSQRKVSVIGAITTIDVDRLKVPTGKISNSLAGRLAGVIAVQRSGEPGQSSNFWVRGISTFGENKNPLILVDGVERSLDLLDPEDIESFSILKDATATAVYGVRGANGVIVVNTRRGKEGKPDVNVKIQSGILAPTKLPKLANSATWANMYNIARTSHGYAPLYTETEIEKYRKQSDPYLYPSIDWVDELMKDYTTSQRVNLNVTGGGPIARYYVSGAFYNENGLFIKDPSHEWDSEINYKRFNFVSNVDVNLHRTTVLKLNINGVLEMKHQPYESISTIFNQAVSVSPNVVPLYYPDLDEFGNRRYSEATGGNIPNPYNTLTQRGYNDNWWTKINAIMALEQDFSELITPGLKATVKFSYDSNSWNQILREGSPHTWYAKNRDESGNLIYEENSLGSNTLGYTSYANGERALYLEGNITYNQTFGEKHNVGGLLLYNQREYQIAASSSIGALPYRNQGLAGRLTYSYDDRYFIEGNFGYNGSENFARGHRFGFFPAGAIGWVVSNEKFLQGKYEALDILKLKVSLGQSGNDKIGGGRRFVYLPTINSANGTNWGTSNTWVGGITVGEYANNNVSWETSTKLNIGLESQWFNGLRFQIDYFQEKRDGIFVQRKSIPDYVGVTTMPWSNVGKMKNRGVDATLEFDKQLGDVFLSARGTFTFARNKQISDDQPDYIDKYRNRNGQRYNQQYGLVALGLFESEEEIENSPTQYGVSYLKPGDIKYKDINGDGVVDTSDEVPIGYSNVPEIVYGIGVSASYKGFDLSLFFQGIANTTFFLGGAYFPFNYPNIGQTSFLADLEGKYFDPAKQNFDAELPLLYSDGWHGSNYVNSTWWQRSGAFLRLKNAEIGYTLPKPIANKLLLKSVRFFLTGENLLTFAPDVKLWDPETGSQDGRGYPLMKTVNLGLSINF